MGKRWVFDILTDQIYKKEIQFSCSRDQHGRDNHFDRFPTRRQIYTKNEITFVIQNSTACNSVHVPNWPAYTRSQSSTPVNGVIIFYWSALKKIRKHWYLSLIISSNVLPGNFMYQ